MKYKIVYLAPNTSAGVPEEVPVTLDINAINVETKERAVVFSNKTNDVVAVVPIHRLLYIMEA